MAASNYWKKREEENLRKNLKTEAEYAKEIERIYRGMMDDIQKDIDAFYGRYASKEGISISEAKKRVSKLDIEEYGRKAKRYVKEKNFSKQANEEMRLYNLTMKVNRLELLKAQIGLELVSGFDELQQYFEQILTERSLEEFKRQAGILGDTVSDTAAITSASVIAGASFYNATFSDRIWMHQDLLKAELAKLLRTGLIQGRNPRELARQLRKVFNTSKYNAERLMRTEMARVQVEAQRQSYERNGFEQYKYIACHDMKACEICKALDGKTFDVSEMAPGENAPPLHPNCRCSTAAHIDDKEYEDWLSGYKEHGMSFKEWREKESKVEYRDRSKNKSNDSVSGWLIERFTKRAREINDALDKYTTKKTYWSEKINSAIDMRTKANQKEWDCSITLTDSADDYRIRHELLHARSISEYGEKKGLVIYRKHRVFEETVVDFFNNEIAKAENDKIPTDVTAYTLSSARLKYINQKAAICDTDLDFARQLFEQPTHEREQWLKGKIKDGCTNFADYNKCMYMLEKVKKWS